MSERKIKKGRYKGQPEGTPDCEIYSHKDSTVYVTNKVWADYRLSFDESGCFMRLDSQRYIENGEFRAVYEPGLYSPNPYDRVGFWVTEKTVVSLVAIRLFKDTFPNEWDNIILITDAMIRSDTVPTTQTEVNKMDREGKITWIKRSNQ